VRTYCAVALLLAVSACAPSPNGAQGRAYAIVIHEEDPAIIARMPSPAPGETVRAYAIVNATFRTCRVTMPWHEVVDEASWRDDLVHEIRHCRGERHDAQGVWR
jgi:hypothetical protein